MSFAETLVILLVAMIVLGPKKLPGAARKVGHWMGMVRRAGDEFKRQIMTMDQQVEDRLNRADDALDRLVPTDEEIAQEAESLADSVDEAFGAPPTETPDDAFDAPPTPTVAPPPPTPAGPPPAEPPKPRSLGLSPTPPAPARGKEAPRG